jgi:hypothetical protein
MGNSSIRGNREPDSKATVGTCACPLTEPERVVRSRIWMELGIRIDGCGRPIDNSNRDPETSRNENMSAPS